MASRAAIRDRVLPPVIYDTASPSPTDPGLARYLAGSHSPYYGEVKKIVKETFGLASFRENQLEAILATLAGLDVFILKPTGGGKSLCFQAPALCVGGKTRGVTVVISPLTSLMMDQVNWLLSKGVDAVLITHDQIVPEQAPSIWQRLNGPDAKPKIVFVTPEKMAQNADLRQALRYLYMERMLARFAVDEAHLLGTWGRDFRDAVSSLSIVGIICSYPAHG